MKYPKMKYPKMKSFRRYALAFAIWFTISVLAIWLSLRDYSATPENLKWTIDASK